MSVMEKNTMYGNRKTCRFMMTLLASSIMTAVNAYAAEEEYDFELDTISVTANKYSQDLVSLSGQAEVANDKTLEEHEVRGVKPAAIPPDRKNKAIFG